MASFTSRPRPPFCSCYCHTLANLDRLRHLLLLWHTPESENESDANSTDDTDKPAVNVEESSDA